MKIRLGSRPSQLAIKQALMVKEHLLSQYPDLDIELIKIVTQGDQDQHTPLYEIGGKGSFIRSLEKALIETQIDIAVHSLKDVTAAMMPGLELSGFLKAETACDSLVFHPEKSYGSFQDLPKNAILATSSLRRKAQLLNLNPNITLLDIRGNIDTRLEKLKNADWDGTLLSEVGLIRLNLNPKRHIFKPQDFIPAPGQGVIALQTRIHDKWAKTLSKSLSDPHQELLSKVEIGFLEEVGLNCQHPLGAHARFFSHHQIHFTWFIKKNHSNRLSINQEYWPIETAETQARQLGITWKQGGLF